MPLESTIPNVLAGDAPFAACASASADMDNEAFASFYERSARSLWAYLARVSSDPALADDLMQESFVRFLCADYPRDGEVAARRYLFRIATNLLRDHWRRPRSSSIDEIPEELYAAHAPADGAISQFVLGAAMAQMRPRDRQLLWLAYAEGYSHREIADVTGLASASIRLLLFRARRKMARLLREAMRKVRHEPLQLQSRKEVADLLHRGHWPQACPADLRAHCDSCRSCSDLVVVARTLQSARAHAAGLPPHCLPAGALWWRAQHLRRRNQAIERMNKPILGAQIFAFAMVFVIAAGFLMWEARRGFQFFAWIEDLPQALHFEALLPNGFPHLSGAAWLLLPIVASLALVSGVVAYIANEKQCQL